MNPRKRDTAIWVGIIVYGVVTLISALPHQLGPGLEYMWETVTPAEVEVCAGEFFDLNYVLRVTREVVAGTIVVWVPLDESGTPMETLQRSTPVILYRSFRELGKQDVHFSAFIPTDLEPGVYERRVISTFENSRHADYFIQVTVLDCP